MKRIFTVFNTVKSLIFCVIFLPSSIFGQTYFDMSSGNYSENFTAWSGYSTNWNGLAILNVGSIPIATKTTVVTNGTLAVVAGSTALGYDVASSTKLVFLTTGTTDLSSAVACDLNLNFTGRTPLTISFDAATIFNSTGNRVSTLRLYYSIDGTNWVEVTGTNLPYLATNNVVGSASVSANLPIAIKNEATVKLRFYSHNGSGGSTGSRPKISIDNVLVTSDVALKVDLLSLDVFSKAYNNTLIWQTTTEKNNAQFQIERSNDGEVFSKIGEVKGRGNSSVVQNYAYTDASPVKGINYYRLRQVDFDGTESVSKTVSVNFDGKGQNKFKVYPTLVKDAVNVELSDESKSEIAVRDLTGRVILTQNTEGVSNTTLNLGALSSGLYILSVRSNETLETVKIYKQ